MDISTFIGISAHASQPDVDKGLNVGMDDYKNKPVTLPQLKELIASDEQQAMFNRLNEIETNEARSFDSNKTESETTEDEEVRKYYKTPTSSIEAENVSEMPPKVPSRDLTCLLLSPPSTESHAASVKDAVQEAGWKSTCANNDREAITFLKMRHWDVILADESFSNLILEFRQWESQNRN